MTRLRFRRHQHIRSGRDFQRAYREGARARGAILMCVVVENGLPHTRLGLSVGKVIWKRAVRRNYVRRVFREAFRLSLPELPVGVDIVLVPAERGLVPDLEATRRELVAMAHKAHRRALEKRARAAERAAEDAGGGAEDAGGGAEDAGGGAIDAAGGTGGAEDRAP